MKANYARDMASTREIIPSRKEREHLLNNCYVPGTVPCILIFNSLFEPHKNPMRNIFQNPN